MHLRFHDDPAAFLDVAAAHLEAEPVLSTVVATVSRRAVQGRLARGPFPRWWLTVHVGDGDGYGEVVGLAMRTAAGGDGPAYLTAMPDEAAVALARAVVERGEVLASVNGALPAARVAAQELARLTGGVAEVVEHTRLHLLDELVAPLGVPGRLREATYDDLELCLAWYAAFEAAAAAQSGRASTGPLEPQDADLMRARIDAHGVWLWVDEHDQVVHLTGANAPAYGVARVGPVYTPDAERGHGYASAAVAGVSAALRATGAQVCLFTDQANPVSNRVYEALGYAPLVDTAHLTVRPR